MIFSKIEQLIKQAKNIVLPFLYRKDLRKLAAFYNTDKWGGGHKSNEEIEIQD
jgi:hypothetical protein